MTTQQVLEVTAFGINRSEYILENLGLAYQTALRFASRTSVPVGDLQSAAAEGLIQAVDRFDPERGTAFSTMAVPWIERSVRRCMAEAEWALVLPDKADHKARRCLAIVYRFHDEHGRYPTTDEVADVAGLDPQMVADLMRAVNNPLSLDQPAPNSGGARPLGQFLGAADNVQSGATSDLDAALHDLPADEFAVIDLLLGLNSGIPLGYSEAAAALEISRETLRKRRTKAINRLRAGLGVTDQVGAK